MARPTNEERIKNLEESQNKLLERLEESEKETEAARQAARIAEAKLEEAEVAEKKETDPMSGPGVLCEATKVTLAEAWQLKSVEVTNPMTQTQEMKSEPVPEGYVARQGPNNGLFVIKPGDEKLHLQEAAIPNCKSKYTRELSVYGAKPNVDSEGKAWRGNFEKEPPRYKVHLCEKHAKMFGAKTNEQLKEEGKKLPA